MTEEEISRILSSYGTIEKVLLLINKAHAFIQFSTLEEANQCLAAGDNLYIHTKKITVNYSGRDAIHEDRIN